MNSAKLYPLLLLCLLLGSPSRTAAQQPASTGTATITGQVTVDGGALAGIQLMLQRVSDKPVVLTPPPPPLTAVTDADGNYRFANVPAGKYTVQIYAPAYVVERKAGAGDAYPDVVVEDGANIQSLDFKLVRGGVITGKLTDPEGRPMIEETINLSRLDEQGKPAREGSSLASLLALALRRTDDRGVYRIFGIKPGRYQVSAGGSAGALSGLLGGKPEFKTTYYPGTANEAEARVVEVRAGVETDNIDFTLLRAETKKGYVASGRVIEAETGKPVAGVMVFYAANSAQPASTGMGMSNATTNSQGEFRFENLATGPYTLTVANLAAFTGGSGNELYSEPLPFEISNSDALGLVLKMSRGTTLSGTAVLDGVREPQAAAKLTGLMLVGMPEVNKVDSALDSLSMMSGMAMGTVNGDGSFQLKGVRPGKYRLTVQSMVDKTLSLLRIEQNGVPVETVDVPSVAPVAGVRVVMGIGSAIISGRVEVRGTLPPGARIQVMAQSVTAAGAAARNNAARVDASGKFSFEGLLPGAYEISVASISLPGNQPVLFESAKQTITLADKARQALILYIDLKEKEKDQ
jgi:protocatechuate 3,4-dioxygenase beta subunit